MTNLIALPSGTELVGDYRIERVLGAGGFGVTYLADEIALARMVTIKEYFPSDIAARDGGIDAAPRSQDCAGDYRWGLDRFIEEAQTLAKFDHTNIVRVYRYFRANNTGYMVLHFEEGQSLKGWLKGLGRAPRQKELDAIIGPLLDALELIHKSDFLHRDIAPDNIIIRKSGDPVLIDFGSARGEIASHTKTVSALVKPGYSPYEQYAETSRQQGPWTDIYALGGTLYHAVTGKRPPDAPSRMVKDELVPAREAALSSYRAGFLKAIDKALALNVEARPQSIAAWRGDLLAPDPVRAELADADDRRPQEPQEGKGRGGAGRRRRREGARCDHGADSRRRRHRDAPGPKGGLLDFLEGLRKKPDGDGAPSRPRRRLSRSLARAGCRRDGEARGAAARAAAQEEIAVEEADPQGARARRRQVAGAPAAAPAEGQPPQPAADRLQAARRRRRRQRCRRYAGSLPAVREPRLGDDHHRTSCRPSSRCRATLLVTPIAEFEAHRGSVSGAAYSDDGRRIVTTGADGTMKVWDAAPPHLRPHHRARRRAGDLAGAQRLARAHRPRQRQGRAVGHRSRREDRHRAAQRGEHLGCRLHRRSQSLRHREPRLEGRRCGMRARPAAPLQVLDGHENSVQALAYAPQQLLLASGGADKTVRVWDLDTLDLKRTYSGPRDFVTSVAFSQSGKLLAAGALDGRIQIWSVLSSRRLRALTGHQRPHRRHRLLAVGRSARLGRRGRHGAVVGSAARTHPARAHRPRRRRHCGRLCARRAAPRLGRRRRARAPVGYSARPTRAGIGRPRSAL